MKLSELKSETLVLLEVITKDKTLNFGVSIWKILNNSLYLNVVSAGNKYLCLGKNGMFPEASYNLIFVDDNVRVEWRNLNLVMSVVKNTPYYMIEIKHFIDLGRDADRRVDNRIDVHDITGTLLKDNESYEIEIRNISVKGIGFSYSDNLDLVNKEFDIKINHTIRDTDFDLTLPCVCKQSRCRDDMQIYGCEVKMKDNKYAVFVNSYRLMLLAEMKGISFNSEPSDIKKSDTSPKMRTNLYRHRG